MSSFWVDRISHMIESYGVPRVRTVSYNGSIDTPHVEDIGILGRVLRQSFEIGWCGFDERPMDQVLHAHIRSTNGLAAR